MVLNAAVGLFGTIIIVGVAHKISQNIVKSTRQIKTHKSNGRLNNSMPGHKKMKDMKGSKIFSGGMGATGKGKSFKKLYPGKKQAPSGRRLSDLEGGAQRGVGHAANFGNKVSGTKIRVTDIKA